jgi:hypothetical protein
VHILVRAITCTCRCVHVCACECALAWVGAWVHACSTCVCGRAGLRFEIHGFTVAFSSCVGMVHLCMCVYVHMSVCRHSHFRDNLLVTGFHKQCLCADSCVHLRVRNVCKSTLLRSSLQSQAILTTIETPLNPPARRVKRRRVICDNQVDVFTFVQPWADLILAGVRGSIVVCICKVRSHHALACFSPVCGDARVEMHRLRALVWRTCMFTFSCMRMCGHMYVCLCVHMYMCMHVCTCVRICMCAWVLV